MIKGEAAKTDVPAADGPVWPAEVVTRQLTANEIKKLEEGITSLQDIQLNLQQVMVQTGAPTKIMDKLKKCDANITTVIAISEAMLTRSLCEKKPDARVSSRN